jgi:elongator complex protein 3
LQPRRQTAFDPEPHREVLAALIQEIAEAAELDAPGLDRIVRRHPKGAGLFSKSDIIAGFRAFGGEGVDESDFIARLRLRPVRTLSGVTPVTVLTKPFPCPGTCIFCPNDVRMPKSYLADEPGAQRAEDNDFDPYLQTWNRLDAYRSIGHPVEKVELIVLGGTWSFLPEAYQLWFVTRCLDAMSDFGAGIDARADAGLAPARYREIAEIDGREMAQRYNDVVIGHLRDGLGGEVLHDSEHGSWPALVAAQQRNEDAGARCVGLVVETRPDHVSEREVLRLRGLGVTKVQLGIQSLDDAVLRASRRGHDVATTRQAVKRLRAAGFKIHAHWMANLPGATPRADVADFARLFADPDFRPDELKLYPCMLVESAELMGSYERGEWRPYSDDALVEVLGACIAATPRWCRLTRVVRDFSAHDIVAGTHKANLREVAERRLADEGRRSVDVRRREIRGEAFEREALALRVSEYATSVGVEHFLEYVTPEDQLVGFLRLALPSEKSFVGEIEASALVREVHVYGTSLPLGAPAEGAAQHTGLGRSLVEEAARRARAVGYGDLAVISAIGTRAWYRALGFEDGALYQHLPL